MYDHLSGNLAITVVLGLLVIIAVSVHHQSLAEALGVALAFSIAAGLFLLSSVPRLHLPATLRSANAGEHQLITWAFRHNDITFFAVVAAIVIGYIFYSGFSGGIAFALAIIGVIAFTPYVINIYPLPDTTDYYFTVLHQPWLPAEKITLSSGKVIYGYVLSTNNSWFTVLRTKDRGIVYIPAGQVVRQAVCEPLSKYEPKQYPPLITFLYRKPAHIPACAKTPRRSAATPSRVRRSDPQAVYGRHGDGI